MIYQAITIQLIFCMLYWLVAYAVYRVNLYGNIRKSYGKASFVSLFVFWAVVTIYAIFEFAGGDYFHYKEFYEVNHIKGINDGLDPIYIWLMDTLPHNFYLWRFVIWGCAAFLWVLIIRYLNQNLQLAACFFLLIVFFQFVGARQTLGFSILYLGVSLFLYSKEKTINKILGIILFCLSYFFHSTLIVYMLLILGAILPVFNKKMIVLSLVFFPILYILLDTSVMAFVSNSISALSEDSAVKINDYLESDFRATSNILGIMMKIVSRTPILILLFYSIKKVFWDKEKTDYLNVVLIRMTFFLVYLSYLFNGKDVSAFISPRFWDASLFPLTLLLTNFCGGKRFPKLLKICIMMLFISKLLTYLLAIFNS